MSPTDIQATEKRLLQTMDMILVKKKRIALARRGVSDMSNSKTGAGSRGIWDMLRNVAGSNGTESILSLY